MTNLQEIQKMEEHIKRCHMDTIYKIQIVRNYKANDPGFSINKLQGK